MLFDSLSPVPTATRETTEGAVAAVGARRGAATRATILDRAVEVATAEGLEALTIGRLAGELGMSKSGLFAHFGSKQDLQLATIAAAAEHFREAVLEPALAAEDGVPRLRAVTAGYLADIDSDAPAGGCFWGSTSAEFDDRPGPVRDAIAAALDAWFAELTRQARVAGVEDPERFAFQLYSLIMGSNSRYRLSGDRRVFGYAAETIEAMLDGVSA